MARTGGVSCQQGLRRLDEHQVLQVLLFLPPQSSASVRATSRSGAVAKAAGSEPLWAAHAERAFGLAGVAACKGPQGEDCASSWARAFALWHGAAREVGLRAPGEAPAASPLPARWIALWCRLQRWLQKHAPAVAGTLRPAACPAAFAQLAEHGLDGAQPGVFGLWRVIDGQDAPMEHQATELGMRQLSRDDEWSHGLLGGYAAYDHDVSTILLPMHAAIRLTVMFRELIPSLAAQHPTKLAFACSYNLSKAFFVDVRNGGVWVWTRRARPLLEAAAPASVGTFAEATRVRLRNLNSQPDLNNRVGTLTTFDRDSDRWQVRMDDGLGMQLIKEANLELTDAGGEEPMPGLFRWLEEFTRRLEGGIYVVKPLRPEQETEQRTTRGISLFPATGAELSRCVTQGVEVTASCVYMPENRQGWTYSIALRLVGTAAERGYETCQLDQRHWVIQEDGRNAEHVRGGGVVGFFPILADGGWLLNEQSDPNLQYSQGDGHVPGEFRYQSCSGRSRRMRGSFSGDLTFIPGTRRQPTGPAFQARLEEFRLCIPEFIY
mmetsp:Transcript_49237/g.157489  ORF Transcript_49237/g.157489 Transcript_49237/m.157489 type:complete len:549 (-) Transcript_49237:124-1770(-)